MTTHYQKANSFVGVQALPDNLHPYVRQEIAKLPMGLWPRYFYYRYRYEEFPKQHRLDDFPPCLQIEPTSICNYRCVFCYQTDSTFTAKANGHMGHMTLDLFKQIVDEAEGRCEAVTLASRGEPLAHPQIEEMLAYCRGKFLGLKLNTNAWFLTDALCHALLQAELNTIVFSVDAASEPQYSQLRVGGNLARVLGNITRFKEIQQAQYPHTRTITRVSGVKVDGTPELAAMQQCWGDLVDQVVFVTYNPWENTYDRPRNEIDAPCSDLWRRMFVWWDGTVNPCDVDYKSTLSVGTFPAHSLSALWRSQEYDVLRDFHLRKRRGACSPCDRCTVV